MLNGKRVVCVIPARLMSKRFPKKVLQYLAGKPILQWIWESASSISLFDEVVFAVDAPQTAELICQFNGKHIMTSALCHSGTDRLVELCCQEKVKGDLFVCWQGDEPGITHAMIKTLLQNTCVGDIWTLKKRMRCKEEIHNPNAVKVVCGKEGRALYFSRSPIPYVRDVERGEWFQHVGLYAYTQKTLERLRSLLPSPLEEAEKLEQLRFLENNMDVRVFETTFVCRGIDTKDDLLALEPLFAKHDSLKLTIHANKR